MQDAKQTKRPPSGEDPHVKRLRRLFEDHPVWREAARYVSPAATSAVHFAHRPGEDWQLAREAGATVLRRGLAADPDFAFRFTPRAIERLEATRGGIADFALALFALIEDPDPEVRIGFRVVAPFSRLVEHGYVRLLAAAGPRILRSGIERGISTVAALRRLVERHRRSGGEA
jgi:hypothetical protein